MKKLLAIIGVAALLATVSNAQTTNSNTGTFFNSVEGYFASFNTNLDSTFLDERLEVAVGVDSVQNGRVPLENSLRLSYTVYQPSNSVTAVSLESVTEDSGVAGTVVSEQVGTGLSFIVHDTKLTGYLDGVWDFNPGTRTTHKGKTVNIQHYGAEIGIRVQKALTAHTFAGIGMGVVLPQNEQKFQAFTGFTF